MAYHSILVRTLFATCLLSSISCLRARADSASDQVRAANADDDLTSEFRDKIVMVEVNRSSAMESKSSSVTIQNARFSKVGGRYFIVGNSYVSDDSDYTRYKDVIIGVPWDNVLRYQAFTPDQFAEYVKQWKEHSKD